MIEWIMLIIIYAGGHAYELSRPYPTEVSCLEAVDHIPKYMRGYAACVPAPKPEETK